MRKTILLIFLSFSLTVQSVFLSELRFLAKEVWRRVSLRVKSNAKEKGVSALVNLHLTEEQQQRLKYLKKIFQ